MTDPHHRPWRDRRHRRDRAPIMCPECVGGGYVLPGLDASIPVAFGHPPVPVGELDICPRCDGTGVRQ